MGKPGVRGRERTNRPTSLFERGSVAGLPNTPGEVYNL